MVTGGNVSSELLKRIIKERSYDILIAVDGALEALHRIAEEPDYIVGDFDTVSTEILRQYPEEKIFRHPAEKDQTDTELALETAVKAGCDEVVLLGATGSRLDHSLANIFLLEHWMKQGVPVTIYDENNRLYVKNKSFAIRKEEQYGAYVSLLPLTERVENVTLNGFRYPLLHHVCFRDATLGVSNEITEETATIEFTDGIFLVIESKDK